MSQQPIDIIESFFNEHGLTDNNFTVKNNSNHNHSSSQSSSSNQQQKIKVKNKDNRSLSAEEIKAEKELMEKHGIYKAMKTPQFIEAIIDTYKKNHTDNNYIEEDSTKTDHILMNDVYYNDKYLKSYITYLYNQNNDQLLKIKTICDIFNRNTKRIKYRMKNLNLLNYFEIEEK